MMTPQEHAHAQAINEFEAMHGSPQEWAPWEQSEYSMFVPVREERLLNAALAEATAQPTTTPAAAVRSTP